MVWYGKHVHDVCRVNERLCSERFQERLVEGFQNARCFHHQYGCNRGEQSYLLPCKDGDQKGDRNGASLWLLATLVLGVSFVALQFYGFSQIISMDLYFTGPKSTVTTSFVYIVTIAHLAHLFAGIIVLLVVIYNHFKQKYDKSQTLGLELGAMFWHFLDILWVYLFLFFYFY